MKYLLFIFITSCLPKFKEVPAVVTKILSCGANQCRVEVKDIDGDLHEIILVLPYVGMKTILRFK